MFWLDYTSKLNRFTSISELWNLIRCLKGNPNKTHSKISALKVESKVIIDDQEKANEFGKHFLKTSSKTKKGNKELLDEYKSIDYKGEHDSVINEPFTMMELEKVLNIKKTSAPGEDGLIYTVFQNLPTRARKTLLCLYNRIWSSGTIPEQCKHAMLIPILKPNKDSSQLTSYRPISLLPCFIKILESMVKERLEWFIEKNEILSSIQHGFRKKRSSIDNLVHLENEIQKYLFVGMKTIVVFIDLAKAYDTLWTKGLIIKLRRIGLQGNILIFLRNYLLNRTFQVQIGNAKSAITHPENGLPQGSILSSLLFNIMISDIPLRPDIHSLIYADDIVIWESGHDVKQNIQNIQQYLNSLNSWLNPFGLIMSVEKTTPILFSNNTNDDNYELYIRGQKLTPHKEHKYLGVTFDKRMTWRPHLLDISKRCKGRINVIKSLAYAKWSGDAKELVMIYKALILSIIDYGCEAYNSATTSAKNMLNSVQYQSLFVCAGARKGTSLKTLQVELGEMPFDLRREMLSIKLRKRIESMRKHPLNEDVKDCWQFNILGGANSRLAFGRRTKDCLLKFSYILEDPMKYFFNTLSRERLFFIFLLLLRTHKIKGNRAC